MDGGNSTTNETAKIEMSSMDGSNRTTIVSDNLGLPVAIAVNHPTGEEGGQIYWTDQLHGRIESATLSGSNRRVVMGELTPYQLIP